MALGNYLRDVKKRITEVRMLHIGLGDYRWLLMDVWFVLTGRV
jgi:hypothetical protein